MQTKADIRIYKLNESFAKIDTEHNILNEMKRFVSAKVDGYRFMPAFKTGFWDGSVSALKGNKIPIGLVNYLNKFAKGGNYSIYINFDVTTELTKIDILEFIETLELPFAPYDYQIEAVYEALKKSHLGILSPTSSGKSLVIYIIVSFLRYNNMKSLIVVPTTSLVDQLFSDFVDYNMDDPYNTVHKILGGQPKTLNTLITIGTYQSVTKIPKSALSSAIGGLIIDESHTAASTSVKNIAEKCENASFRIGLSGTYPEKRTVPWFAIVGSIGEIKRFVDYKKLKEDKRVANLLIKRIILKHSEKSRRFNFETNKKEFQAEIDYTNNHEDRNRFIVNLAKSLKGNVLILFTKIKHGTEIKQHLENSDKKILYVDGGTPTEERNQYREIMENKDNVVGVFSFGTSSAGINIKNIHHIIFASGYKSKFKVIQSIGRGLRTNDNKTLITLYDLIDDLYYEYKNEDNKTKTYFNHSLRHANERKKLYLEEGYDDIKTINLLLSKN